MAEITEVFEALEKHYAQQLPFVVYSRPINSIIKCWLQRDESLKTTSEFTESGFVFAPFDLDEEAIVFEEKRADHFSVEVDHLEVENSTEVHEIKTSTTKEVHLNLIENGINAITKGQFKKVVLSRQLPIKVSNAKPLDIFKRLFNTYKNAMVYCWYHPKVGLWLGATPELLFKVEGLDATTISLAGTKPYEAIESQHWTSKETEEQEIVTDYIYNQLQPLSTSVKIKDIETVRAGNLMHLKTRILARLKPSFSLKSLIDALHPTPAVCGFPKAPSKAFILDNENYQREFYTGFLGELNLTSSKNRNTNRKNIENNAYKSIKKYSNFYVNLRCMKLENECACLYVGGGITKDSIPKNEWEETVAKSKTMLKVL